MEERKKMRETTHSKLKYTLGITPAERSRFVVAIFVTLTTFFHILYFE